MPSPKDEALALLKQQNISLEVIDALAVNIVNAPLDESGNLDLPALRARYKGDQLEVTSHRIRNITINWFDVLTKIGLRTGGIEMTPVPDHHPVLARMVEALNAIQVLHGASEIKLGPKSAQIVKELWIARDGVAEVSEDELAGALQDRIPGNELPELLGNLKALGIISRKDGKVIKSETFTLVA
jgi:hypothetical protein